MNVKKIVSSIGIGAGAVILGLGIQYASAQWSAAPSNPPTCPSSTSGCNAPINVGSSYQSKAGGLALGTTTSQASMLDVEGIGYLQSLILGKNSGSTFQYLDGNQAAGKVLTSDANGNASWQVGVASSSVSGSIGGGCYMVASNDGTDYTTGNAYYSVWGNASTSYPLPTSNIDSGNAANTNNDANACTCPSGYTSRITGQTPGASQTGGNGKYISGSGAFRPAFDTTFACIKN
jgi:hypothetical protein